MTGLFHGRNLLLVLLSMLGLFASQQGWARVSTPIGSNERSQDAGRKEATAPLSLSCKSDKFRVKLVPVCPRPEEDPQDVLTVEEAKHPILSVEARAGSQVDGKDSDPQGPLFAAMVPPALELGLDRLMMMMKRVDLKSENLFVSVGQKEFEVDYSALASALRHAGVSGDLGQPYLYFSVCDDSEGEGRCSNRNPKKQLGLRVRAYEPCHVPEVVPIAVWAGCR